MNPRGNRASLQVSLPATSRSTRTLLFYLFRPLQLLNLNEPIRVAQLMLPLVA
jgi:hypothetical protein